MIRYFIPENPDDRIIKESVEALYNHKLIAFPTDTNWVIAAGVNSKKGIDALYDLKGTDHKKHFSLVCNSISQASEYAVIYDGAYRMIRSIVPGPYTLIFGPSKRLPRGIRDYTKDKEIGIRIPDVIMIEKLVTAYDGPLISTSIHPNWLDSTVIDNNAPIYSYQIEDFFGSKVEIVLDGGENHLLGDSSVIDFSHSDGPTILRYGAGDLSFFK